MTQQQILDPDDTSTSGTWTPPGPIPKSVRSFGRFPDIDSWRPGDLVLVSSSKQPYLSRKIIAFQENGGFAPDDARWHHAAVYVGQRRICEALVTGVTTSLIYKYIGNHKLRVRRDPQISPSDGYEVALNAMLRMRSSYSFWTILRMMFQSRRGFYDQPAGMSLASSRATICSKLYADAYSLATMRVLGNAADDVPTPAFLSSTNLLQDVPSSWFAIGW